MTFPSPALPPLLTGHPGTSSRRSFDEACLGAVSGRFEAGDLVWKVGGGRVEAALVLESRVKPRRAREMLFVATVAAGDAIGALISPEVAITWDWPATLHANDGATGHLALEVSREVDELGAPNWLTIGLSLALRPAPNVTDSSLDPGHDPWRTTLYDEGCGAIPSDAVISAWARYLLTWIDTWQQDGFAPVRAAWEFRVRARGEEVAVLRKGEGHRGRLIGLDDHGGLVLEGAEGTVVLEPQNLERGDPGPVGDNEPGPDRGRTVRP
ncbi:biotin/lipoate--protein ligase family protein [Breoghania sp.]|uniref:biotin/lipoate--protein ligase family protein n=1 Tax=Breoghania sp. TaxID=2065378 RepID=UPI0026077BC0|nr:biotin/lipoate--protein ligase family protein [Breoghania sp.]MDJ0931412.1 biotin/lipoate--protein ligase family protein [Breoghania sp.]